MEFLSLETIQELANQYGYLAVFVGILLENLGIPLPGETITIVGGFLAGSGELNYWFVLATAAMGAFIGGIGGYFVGSYGGWKAILSVAKIFRIQELQLEEIKTKFSENAVRAVFFGRFIPLIRIFSSRCESGRGSNVGIGDDDTGLFCGSDRLARTVTRMGE
jgi:membrane protein DedA with SNARE-associated domain